MASRDISAVDFDEVGSAMNKITNGVNHYVEIFNNFRRSIDSINESNPGSEVLLNRLVDNLQGALNVVQDCPQIVGELSEALKKKSEELESANSDARRKLDQII